MPFERSPQRQPGEIQDARQEKRQSGAVALPDERGETGESYEEPRGAPEQTGLLVEEGVHREGCDVPPAGGGPVEERAEELHVPVSDPEDASPQDEEVHQEEEGDAGRDGDYRCEQSSVLSSDQHGDEQAGACRGVSDLEQGESNSNHRRGGQRAPAARRQRSGGDQARRGPVRVGKPGRGHPRHEQERRAARPRGTAGAGGASGYQPCRKAAYQ